MKFIYSIFTILFFTITLQAEYLRSIQLGSFKSPLRIQSELAKVKQFASEQENIVRLQEEWDFEFKHIKKGQYYVIVAEPFRTRAVMQEVVDTLRLAYPDAYPTKLDSAPPFVKKAPKTTPQKAVAEKEITPKEPEIIQEQEVIQEKVTPKEAEKELIPDPLFGSEIISEEEVIVEEVKKPIKQMPIELPTKKEITKKESIEYTFDEKKSLEVEKVQVESDEGLYKVLFFITLFLLLIVALLLLRYKKKNINCKDRESYTLDLFNKKDMEIKHKDSFLSHAKHSVADINNFTNLLLEFDLSTIQKDYVQRIRSSSEHLLNTVNNTLDINKLKNGTLRIENTEFDLNEMLKKVSKIIALEAKNKDTEFELIVENDVPPFIFGDPTRIRQVLINLLGNSVKYTQNGKITLTVKTLYNYTHAITLGFIIKDTGIGMSSEQLEEIHAASAEIIDGGTIGIGLSVTKQLIQMMNGEIKIYSTEDVGTTFTFSLKFAVKR